MICKRVFCGLLTGVLVLGVCGCATTQRGASDDELIRQTLATWKSGLESHNIDVLMSTVSEDFVSEEGGSKADFREYVAGLIDDGTLSGAKMDIDNARVTIEEEMATVENAGLSGDRGTVVIDMDLKKEDDGAWRIVGLQAY